MENGHLCDVKYCNTVAPIKMMQDSEKGGGNEMKNSRKMAK
jgi:hypothetical protein